MMTKEQYIDYWVDTAQNDWITVEALFETKRYMHCRGYIRTVGKNKGG